MTQKFMLAKDYAQAADRKIKARGGRKVTAAEKTKRMASILSKGGTVKLGEAMVGPISIRINYEGIARQALVEDLVPQGEIRQYPVLSDLPTAYSLNSNDGQVRISHVEGKTIVPKYGRIAAEWEVDRSDLELLHANIVEYADNMTVQQIMKEEDNLLYNGYDLMIQDWQDLHPGQTDNNITMVGTTLTLDTLIDAQAFIASQQNEAKLLIANPADMYDLYRWDLLTVGVAFKDNYFAGYKQTTFGDWTLLKSVTMPRGVFYVTGAPNTVGIFSTRYGLEATDDVTANSKFKIRKIFNELCSLVLVNNLAVAKITKE